MERPGRASFVDGVLDRLCAHQASRPREKPSAAHGCCERGARRQHHHLAHQAHSPQIPGGRREVRRRAHGVRHGLSLGRVNEQPVSRISELIRIGPISGFRLRTKLLLLALTTLALPWAGCQYAREMETVLRESEQQSLLAVTTTIAGSLKGRQELLFRADSLEAVTTHDARDITPVVLSGAPLIDGRADEWDTSARNLVRVSGPRGDSLRLLAATHERWLYLALLVRDDRWIFDASELAALNPETLGDRAWLAFDDKGGGQQRLFFGSTGPGAVHA